MQIKISHPILGEIISNSLDHGAKEILDVIGTAMKNDGESIRFATSQGYALVSYQILRESYVEVIT